MKDIFISYHSFINDDSEHVVFLDPAYVENDAGYVFNRRFVCELASRLLGEGMSHVFTTDTVIESSLPLRKGRIRNHLKILKDKKFTLLTISLKDYNKEGINIFGDNGVLEFNNELIQSNLPVQCTYFKDNDIINHYHEDIINENVNHIFLEINPGEMLYNRNLLVNLVFESLKEVLK